VNGALDAHQRMRLERLVTRGRRILEEDLLDRASGRFGLDLDGTIAHEDTLHLDPTALTQRRELIDVIDHLRSEGESLASAVSRILREATFTHLNRLVAIRIAEALDLLVPSLAAGRSSQGFRDLLELVPSLAADDTGGYWTYLTLCGDELAGDVPVLFDPRNPLLALTPSPGALDDLVELLAEPGAAELWAAPDCLGWVYQFFNRADERKLIHDAGGPRNSPELAIANQFFTPRYVVDFLVQNTLGRRLVESDPGSRVRDEMPLLVDPPTAPGPLLDLAEARVLDPAVGSGHFLLAAYDILERAWAHAGTSPDAAAPAIVSSLWGIDIDPRCTQVAAAAVILRARRSCPRGDLPRPNILCARALPAATTGLEELLKGLPGTQRELVEILTEVLTEAAVLGPLLKVEDSLAAGVRSAAFGAAVNEGSLADAIAPDVIKEVESEVLKAVQLAADASTATPAERLLAAEADDAVRFVFALQQRYTAVLMNPPFGTPVGFTKPYLKVAYPWIPATSDLFALFVGRGLELCDENGYVGSITSRVGMFLHSFQTWRETVLLGHELPVLADLGEGVMEQAMVEAAAYVLGNRSRRPESRSVFLRAVTSKDRGASLASSVASLTKGPVDDSTFTPDVDRLLRLKGSPVAYWVDPETVECLVSHQPFEPFHGEVRVGLQTGDDFQFVRAWWEVSADRLTRPPDLAADANERMQLARGSRWAPIVKSGSSQPWFSPVLLVVDWENDGQRLRSFVDERGKLKSRPQNTDLYFRPGFSWTRRAPRLVPYVVPAGCIPSVSRYQGFPNGDPFGAVGVVASNVASAYGRFYGEKFLWPNFLVDNVKTLPIPDISDDLIADLADRVRTEVAARREIYSHLEPYREFTVPAEDIGSLKWHPGSLLGQDLENRVASAYGLTPGQANQLELDMHEALLTLGMLDEGVEADDDELGDIPPWGERLISYLVGVAFGRWDVRMAMDPSTATSLPDPFDPLPNNPPGMLVDYEQCPAKQVPSAYPVAFPADGVLVDAPGHPRDIGACLVAAAAPLFDDPEAASARAVSELGGKTLRQYLRKQFFKDHLRIYSKGRRKAPIYWPLYVPSTAWGMWIYAPKLRRETLFAIGRFAGERLDQAEAEIRRLLREREAGGAGRSDRAVANALEAEEKLAEELRRFRDEADRVADLGWEPDLDDGIILCAAPLADLFPAWKDAAAARKEIKAGKYPWATVSKWADQL
jgi:hypothetical protein